MTDGDPRNSLRKLSPIDLRNELLSVTVGGNRGGIDLEKKGEVFAEYVSRAFPGMKVLNVIPTNTAAALNSVSGVITLQFSDLPPRTVFGKIHVEPDTNSINPLGAKKEYEMAGMLADAGWPVLTPLTKSDNPDYPLLLYPVIEEEPLFDKLERSYLSGDVQINETELDALFLYNKKIGEKEAAKVRVGTKQEAIDAPVQTLLLKRFEQGGRIDQRYTTDTVFNLPGLEESITWGDLLDKKWNINGRDYDVTLRQIIDQARKSLAFEGEKETFLTISHGDDHAGNVRLTNPPVVFDPAFAGWNPAALDVKALAHTGFLPMAAMYYPPKGLETNYQMTDERITVTTNMESLPMYQTQEKLAKQIIDTRMLPILKTIKEKGGDIEKEKLRVESGLAACALLTVNIAELLEENDGRAVGLLPMAVMFATLQGMPMLEYLNEEIKKL